jgi:single-stranded-DNA-specific exonuclease
VVGAIDPEQQSILVDALSISPITAAVFLSRGLETTDKARTWISRIGSQDHDPFLLPDMSLAVSRLNAAVIRREKICFYGDYDVDGIAATSLYSVFFRSIGGNVFTYIPHRIREGYGLHIDSLCRIRDMGATLVVTSDCGTTSHAEVEMANRLGLDIIITDHHRTDAQLPRALAVLNPHRADSPYPFSGLCSGGLAYRVTQAYAIRFGSGSIDTASLLDLVALATVADIVPLTGENRSYVREGLRLISKGQRAGIRALKQVAGVNQACNTTTLAFRLAPRINAAGRLSHAEVGVRLLTTEIEEEANLIARELDVLNRQRQLIEDETTKAAISVIDGADVPAALVLWAAKWHAGVIGIVAARIVERFHRPAVVIAVDEHGIGKGSARSVEGFDLYSALVQCRDLLEGFGGHPNAAGLTIRQSHLLEFRDRMIALAQNSSSSSAPCPILRVDAEVSLRDVNSRVIRELDWLHPCGEGNPEPILAAREVTVLSARVVGNGHLKITVRHRNSHPFDGIGFRMGGLAENGLVGEQLMDLAFVPELNRWNGLDRVQLRIRDLRRTQCL